MLLEYNDKGGIHSNLQALLFCLSEAFFAGVSVRVIL